MNVLFLGLGGIGQRHLRNLLTLVPDACIGAVRHGKRKFEITPELNADASVDIEEKYEISCFPDLNTAISEFEPDFAIVATPSSTHASIALTLAKAGIPVFLEKPVSHTEEHLDEILDTVSGSGLPVMIGYMLRFHPAVQKLRDLVRNRALGRIQSVHIVANTYMPDWHPYEKANEFYAGCKDLGGGTILTNIHLIDLMYWILGSPERLWCLGGKLSKFDINVEDTVTATFDYRDEDRPMPVSLNMSFTQKPVENSMVFRCENGTFGWDLGTGVTCVDNVATNERFEHDAPELIWNDLFVSEIEHFIDCVKHGQTPEADIHDAIGGHRIALAMKQSLDSGKIVSV